MNSTSLDGWSRLLRRGSVPVASTTSMSGRTLSNFDYLAARRGAAREQDADDRRALEAIARAAHPEGIQLGHGSDPAAEHARTMHCLERREVTLFDATFVAGRRVARVDILARRRDVVRLLAMKAKPFDGTAHARNIATGGKGLFRYVWPPHRVSAYWREELEDLAFQVLVAERVLPDTIIEPGLILIDERRPDLPVTVDVGVEVRLVREEVDAAAAMLEARLDSP